MTTTTHLGLPLPSAAGSLEEDVVRIIDAFRLIDDKVAALDTLLSSDDLDLDTVQELVDALKSAQGLIGGILSQVGGLLEGKQDASDILSDLSSLEFEANEIIYRAANSFSTTKITDAARDLLAAASAAAQRLAMGLPTATTEELSAATIEDIRVFSPAALRQAMDIATANLMPIGGFALLKTDVHTLTLGGKHFIRSGVLVHPDEVPDWPAWAVPPNTAFSMPSAAGAATNFHYQKGILFSVYGQGGRKTNDFFDTATTFSTLGAVSHIDIKGDGESVLVVCGQSSNLSRSTNNGSNWSNVASGLSEGHSLATDGVVWLCGGFSSGKAAISKSTNNGATWAKLTLPAAFDSATAPARVARIPGTSPAVWLCSAGTGIWRSTDNGTTWVQTKTLDSTPQCISAAADVVLVGGGGAPLWRSTDAGLTWAPVAVSPTWGGVIGVGSVAVLREAAPGRPSSWIGIGYGSTDVRISTDAGLTWTSVDAGLTGGSSVACWSLDGIVTIISGNIMRRRIYGIGDRAYTPYNYLRIK